MTRREAIGERNVTPDAKLETEQESLRTREVQKRSVFVSHTHADRKLAGALKDLIDATYSGIVRTFVSSDPAPGGGIQPGEEWFQRIQSELALAEAVWVLATKSSILRPWVYWEAALGRAFCPGGVVVLRVGITDTEVLSPLNQFQSYDGCSIDAGGIGELVRKVGAQMGMTISPVLVESATSEWTKFVGGYQPDADKGVNDANLSAEQITHLEAVVARLEIAVETVSRRPNVPAAGFPLGVTIRAASGEGSIAERIEAAKRRSLDQRGMQKARIAWMGDNELFYLKPAEFFEKLAGVTEAASVEFAGIDRDGDAKFTLKEGDREAHVYLRGEALLGYEVPEGLSGRAAGWAEQVRIAITEIEEANRQE